MTLREVALEVDLDFTYLSKIENGSDTPGEDTLSRLATFFDVDGDELLELAGRVPSSLTERARQEPELGRLLRRLPGYSPDKLRRIYEAAEIEQVDRTGE